MAKPKAPKFTSHATSERIKRQLSKDYVHGHPINSTGKVIERTRATERSTAPGVHTKAMEALTHFKNYGDNTKMTLIVQSLVTPAWRKALIAWFLRFGQVRWVKQKNAFRGGRPKHAINLTEPNRQPFRNIPKGDRFEGVRVDLMWTKVHQPKTPCVVCGQPAIEGERTCYGHHNK